MTVRVVLAELVRNPIRQLILNWNWKSALVSSVLRAAIFFVANLSVSVASGLRAMATELAFRGAASGVLGSVTQALSGATPVWAATLSALVLLPAIGHALEYVVHRAAGTPNLGTSMFGSIAFSVLTTAFNLFVMRRGTLIVGSGQASLGSDLRRMPWLIGAFTMAGVRFAVGVMRTRVGRPTSTDHPRLAGSVVPTSPVTHARRSGFWANAAE